MRNILLAAFLAFSAVLSAAAQDMGPNCEILPSVVYAEGGRNHVQGIAVDLEKACMYFSFTTSFIKTDMRGNVLGSIDRIQGHLGAMTFDRKSRKVYASLECKDDVIGAGLSSFAKGHSMFYVAVIDVDAVNSIGMDSENNDAFRIACVKDAVDDYGAKVVLDGEEVDHRYSCSGIDGVAIAPKFGRTGGREYLYVAYGIYRGDTRSDNDYQVLLRYRLKDIDRYAGKVKFGDFYSEGPGKPLEKYFIFTGNTEWGVQNMTYDPYSKNLLLAVYRGRKPEFQNYSMFTVDIASKFSRRTLEGVTYDSARHMVLGSKANPQGGNNFKLGSTGMASLGNGLFYISENGRSSETGNQNCKATLFRWTGNPEDPFERQ